MRLVTWWLKEIQTIVAIIDAGIGYSTPSFNGEDWWSIGWPSWLLFTDIVTDIDGWLANIIIVKPTFYSAGSI